MQPEKHEALSFCDLGSNKSFAIIENGLFVQDFQDFIVVSNDRGMFGILLSVESIAANMDWVEDWRGS